MVPGLIDNTWAMGQCKDQVIEIASRFVSFIYLLSNSLITGHVLVTELQSHYTTCLHADNGVVFKIKLLSRFMITSMQFLLAK
jgi:hypothetical protein